MNTLGKILVVLNFVFALVVAGLLSLKYGTETNYRAGEKQLRDELEISYKANRALMETASSASNQLSAAKSDLEVKKQDIALQQATWSVREAELQKAFKDAEARAKTADFNADAYLTAMERMKKEVDALKVTIEDREDRLIKLHVKHKDVQDLAMMLDRDLKFSQERNQILVSRVQELERHISEIISGTKTEVAGALAKDPSAPNPPQKFVKGIVERVDKSDKSLISVSLGTDHGLKVGHTLEVYRLSPNAEYIGMVTIVDAHNHTSVARLIRSPGTGPRAMREGDVVSSSLNPR